jgi:hypothetical protein
LTRQTESVIRSFFEKSQVAGLLLPDGWFGERPMEGHHRLTFVIVLPKRILIELDNQLLLSIVGKPQVKKTKTNLALADGSPTLEIEGFSHAVFEYLEYVNETPHVKSFTYGRICFVSPTN